MWETVTIKHADENESFMISEETYKKDRDIFVRNLGELLSQTREHVVSTELHAHDDDEYVTITFRGGNTKDVNVSMDSYLAIIKDVVRKI